MAEHRLARTRAAYQPAPMPAYIPWYPAVESPEDVSRRAALKYGVPRPLESEELRRAQAMINVWPGPPLRVTWEP